MVKKGFKYYINENSCKAKVTNLPIDTSIKQLTVAYDKKTLEQSIKNEWVIELHGVYKRFVSKNTTTIGIGSGLGEHEELLKRNGYTIISSDIVEGISDTKIDIFKDTLPKGMNLFICGMDSYFENEEVKKLFVCLYNNMIHGSILTFTLRYRDYSLVWIPEMIQYIEAYVVAIIKKKEVFFIHHGYRRSEKEIIQIAKKSGFEYVISEKSLFGYEWSRCGIGLKFFFRFFKWFDKHIHPIFYSATIFNFIKK